MDRIYVLKGGFACLAWEAALAACQSETQAQALSACLDVASLARQAWAMGFGGPALKAAEQAAWLALDRWCVGGALQG